jgi:hypothetical protein
MNIQSPASLAPLWVFTLILLLPRPALCPRPLCTARHKCLLGFKGPSLSVGPEHFVGIDVAAGEKILNLRPSLPSVPSSLKPYVSSSLKIRGGHPTSSGPLEEVTLHCRSGSQVGGWMESELDQAGILIRTPGQREWGMETSYSSLRGRSELGSWSK